MSTTRMNTSTTNTIPIRAVAFDYGGVIAGKIDDDTLAHMADVLGASTEAYTAAMWRYRAPYDAGELDATAYWTAVIADVAADRVPDQATIDLLLRLDAIGWTRVNAAMIRWVAALRREGLRTLIISNMAAATYDMVVAVAPWKSYFEHVVLSGWLGVNKPDRRIFETAASEMQLAPEEILFIDDLEHNVAGARKVGFRALQFADAPALARELDQWTDTGEGPVVPTSGLVRG